MWEKWAREASVPHLETTCMGCGHSISATTFGDPKSDFTPTTAEWSETATPLPSTPASEIVNPVVAQTIRDHPELFKIVTPIKVEIFESYLATHPNRPFVASVCRGLREGFWPWANTLLDGYPETHDVSKPSTHRSAEETFTNVKSAQY